MKNEFLSSLRITLSLALLCAVAYPLLIFGIAQFSTGGGKGVILYHNGKAAGFECIGQKFTSDAWFQGRPSMVDYQPVNSGGSNKSPVSENYITAVRQRLDTFLLHNPGIRHEEIPADLLTASGSGLDPDISPSAAMIQIPRVARARGIPESRLKDLVSRHVSAPLFGLLGPEKVNLLKLNLALEALPQ